MRSERRRCGTSNTTSFKYLGFPPEPLVGHLPLLRPPRTPTSDGYWIPPTVRTNKRRPNMVPMSVPSGFWKITVPPKFYITRDASSQALPQTCDT